MLKEEQCSINMDDFLRQLLRASSRNRVLDKSHGFLVRCAFPNFGGGVFMPLMASLQLGVEMI